MANKYTYAKITDVFSLDERLRYYGDASIEPSDYSYFTFTKNVDEDGNENGTATFYLADIDESVIDLLVVPYKYIDENGKEYIVNTVGEYVFCSSSSPNVDEFTKVILPDSIETVLENAFYQSYVREVNIPKNLRIVKKYAFSMTPCFYNQQVTIPSSVVELGFYSFCFVFNGNSKVSFCANIKEIPEGCLIYSGNPVINILTPIEKMDMGFCSYGTIENIEIPNTVEEISGSLYDNSYVKTITFPSDLKGVPDIDYCQNLETVIIKGKNTTIHKNAFNYCPNVTIHCCSGSKAEIYAIENNIPYVVLDSLIVNNATETSTTDDSGNTTITYSVILDHDKEIRLGEMSNLTLTMPINGVPDTYECSLTFTSGETSTSLIYDSDSIIWHGEDCDSERNFIPESNKTYEISIKEINRKNVTSVDEENGVYVSTATCVDLSTGEEWVCNITEGDAVIVSELTNNNLSDADIEALNSGVAYYLKDNVVCEIEVISDYSNNGIRYWGYKYSDDVPVGTTIYLYIKDIVQSTIVARVGEI